MIFGMPWFDSMFHSMTALSTGGFAVYATSLAAYDSLAIETVTIFLMLVGTTNFAILALLVKGKFKKFFKIGDTRFFAVVLIIMTFIISISGLFGIYSTMSESLRIAVFQIVSALSTTGFSTIDFNTWKPDMLLIIIIAMLIGGGAGSTAGGIKYTRIYSLYKSFIFGLKRRFMPERAVNEGSIYKAEGKVYLSSKYMEEISRFVFVYMVLYFLGTFLLTLGGVPLDKAMFEFASALGTVGISVGVTTVGTSNYILIVQMFGMLLGRLEIFIIFVSVIAVFNKLFRKGRSF
jgi:trk system potassium uptake protein TrkH